MTAARGTVGTLWVSAAALMPESGSWTPTTHDFLRKFAKKIRLNGEKYVKKTQKE
jgi:hypothetical protein